MSENELPPYLETQNVLGLTEDYFKGVLSPHFGGHPEINGPVIFKRSDKGYKYFLGGQYKISVPCKKNEKKVDKELFLKIFDKNRVKGAFFKSDTYEARILRFYSPLQCPVPTLIDHRRDDNALIMNYVHGDTLEEKIIGLKTKDIGKVENPEETRKQFITRYLEHSVRALASLHAKGSHNVQMLEEDGKLLLFVPDKNYYLKRFLRYSKNILQESKKDFEADREFTSKLIEPFYIIDAILQKGSSVIHGDLHPSNIIIVKEDVKQQLEGLSAAPKITFVDFDRVQKGKDVSDLVDMLCHPLFEMDDHKTNRFIEKYLDQREKTASELHKDDKDYGYLKKGLEYHDDFKLVSVFRNLRRASILTKFEKNRPKEFKAYIDAFPERKNYKAWYLEEALKTCQSRDSIKNLERLFETALEKLV